MQRCRGNEEEEGRIIGACDRIIGACDRIIGACVTEGVIMVSFFMGYQWGHLFEMTWEMEANG